MEKREVLLEVKNLEYSFDTYAGEVKAVRGVSFEVYKGETLAIVGESGCGKSVTMHAIMKLNPEPPGRLKGGKIIFDGKDITNYTDKQMQAIRGPEIGMIFQDPMTSLNPTMTVGRQIAEVILKHEDVTKAEAMRRAKEMLDIVGIPNADKRIHQYPHEFSGGMRQRAMIAIALALKPKLLIADEPTTALDVTIQAQILDLMKDLQKQFGTSIIMITHNLGVVADIADRVVVMYAGKIVERGTVEEIFYHPQHPYTWGLLRSVPRLDAKKKEKLVPIIGTPPDLFAPPPGCPFAARCDYAMKICYEAPPEVTVESETHDVACWLKHPYAPKVANPVETGVTANE
ncbi:MAG: ABC-type dipeptide/oligopeptide/nickel transport system ATPase component [Caldanaerobacter subterraneus]|uniref:ABC-type dipeptide/oligopeptide/nickel transport system, ATPase component n=5 Tax=Caldanaerobacter subterraneus TaxID=911092 RepID=Q8RC34_CALS4|nr:ABC transporter ATP-binding protein [Caldanaerobacter subterraneus]AAM23884.1 ABC-type dipeptide/oligopeptide/nickel transport system, ATPase component [Caldanaerobacter subterraneus subsp. tengcongensis MB4]KKC30308.1 ABC-type dipeptide/oligopeptide/nickel transport system, ATPase component [Caldanaerobacter subterraneus subsp. pacificus DSM 12653]KUK09115.1 MAG: ABC-type dipeptide/oligopeptide/nickel transport system ATPase component [Caldanaerobacter subterraneus]MBE3578569.1 ABC transpor